MKKKIIFGIFLFAVIGINVTLKFNNSQNVTSLSELMNIATANAESLTWDDIKSVYSWVDENAIPGEWYSAYTSWMCDAAHSVLDFTDISGNAVSGYYTDERGVERYGVIDDCDGQPNFCGGFST